MGVRHSLVEGLAAVLIGIFCAISGPGDAARAQAPAPGPVQPWGLPPLPAGVGAVEKFADVSGTPQGQFLEGGAFDDQGNLWFVGIGSGWISYLQPDGKLMPVVNCNPPDDIGWTIFRDHPYNDPPATLQPLKSPDVPVVLGAIFACWSPSYSTATFTSSQPISR